MECAKAGCKRRAIRDSNYCREHQPGRCGSARRRKTKKRGTEKRITKKRMAKKKR
jgi:hypothetical protein